MSPDFGTAQEHYVRIGGSEFVPDGSSATGWTNTWMPEGTGYYWRGFFISSFVYPHVYAWIHAPGGSQLAYAELDYCNSDATRNLIMNIYSCDYTGACFSTPIATLTGGANSGCASIPIYSIGSSTVDNYLREYLLDVVWPTPGPLNSSIALAGAIIGWKYQVSPAPGSATFNDVAPGDFGFQWIEALAASGITGGCGGGNYCPNANLTRAQMAIFLSKALGLYWGGY